MIPTKARVTRAACLAGVAVLAVGLVAACGSSSNKGNNATTSGTQSGSSSAPTGTPIKIGAIATESGPQASSNIQTATVAPAWAAWVNANGGIAGHPVQVINIDDKGDPVAGQAAGKQLISQGVVAVLAGSDNLVAAWGPDVRAAGIPIVSGTSNQQDWYKNPGMYVTGTDQATGDYSQVFIGKQFAHATKIGTVYCAEVAACAQAVPGQKAVATQLGLGFTSVSVSSTSPSYTSQCLALKQEKADYVMLEIATTVSAKFISDCQAQGFNPIFGTNEQSLGKALLAVPNATLYGVGYDFPETADSPIVTTFNDAMTKYAKDDNWHHGTASFTWTGLEVIRQSLIAANLSPTATVTTTTIKNALDAVKDNNFGGLTANKLTFTAGAIHTNGTNDCFFVIGVKDNKATAPNGLTPLCKNS